MTRAAHADDPRIALPRIARLDGISPLSRDLLGNKGFGINAMRAQDMPVPPAFCLTTAACADFFADRVHCLDAIWPEVLHNIAWLEEITSRRFGHGARPLLVSVRSGAAQSMPGMLDTVLNLGIDDSVERAMAQEAGSAFARDIRDRFRETYARIVTKERSSSVPDDPLAQLRAAIEAVFESWHSPRAVAYRAHRGLDDSGGTAVVVQAMVFGNRDASSGTGVLFTRDPMTGSDEAFGEWLPGGQGEDVVSGTVDCQPITSLREAQPAVFDELMSTARTLERLSRDVQDIEFTVESGELWILQTRVAKRSAQAAVRLALRLYDEELIDDAEVLRRVTPAHIQNLLQPSLQPETRTAAKLLAKGLAASPGVASGRAYTDVDAALDAADEGEDVVLVRTSTSPDDVAGMLAATAIVTEVGGATSHAAVVSREIGRPAVIGCGRGVAEALAGKLVTIDGTAGEVRDGVLEMTAWSEADTPDLRRLTDIALRLTPLRAHAAGDYPILPDNTEATVRDAMAAGHVDVVSPTPLITMLTALKLSNEDTAWTN